MHIAINIVNILYQYVCSASPWTVGNDVTTVLERVDGTGVVMQDGFKVGSFDGRDVVAILDAGRTTVMFRIRQLAAGTPGWEAYTVALGRYRR